MKNNEPDLEEDMREAPLVDPDEFPEDPVLERHLGKTKSAWDSFLSHLEEAHPTFSTEWRFYKDGKRWLFKVTKKKKTICWVSVHEGMFSTTFYFSDKVEEHLNNSALDPSFVKQFAEAKRYGKVRPLTVEILETSDLEATKILIPIREKI